MRDRFVSRVQFVCQTPNTALHLGPTLGVPNLGHGHNAARMPLPHVSPMGFLNLP